MKVTDKDILDRINEGSLEVDLLGRFVVSHTQNRGSTKLKIIERTSNGSTYKFVKINCKCTSKKIALHRLIWMSIERRIVPKGYDVHHKRGKNIPFPDAYANLELMLKSKNRALQDVGGEAKLDEVF